jgi:N-acetylglucosaminyldiphosphoundecaprenol N-acetyl-beta-D-mannosaminyltransferase
MSRRSRSSRPIALSYDAAYGLRLGGAALFAGNADQLLIEVDSLIASRAQHLIVTPNIDQTLDLERDEGLRHAFSEASLRLIDGAPLVMLARMLGARNVHRNTGADLLPLTAELAMSRSWTIAITGGRDSVSRAAAESLTKKYPGGSIVSVPFPFIDGVDSDVSLNVVNMLTDLKPDIVFLCLGAPKQEAWFMAWRDQLPKSVYVGAGAAVDFAAGTSRRAPRLLQKAGLEWFWRLCQEPRRLAHRYLIKGPKFLTIAARSITSRGN